MHPILDGVAGGKQEHRDLAAFQAYSPHHFKTIQSRQANVQYHGCKFPPQQELLSLRPGMHRIGNDSMPVQYAANTVG